MRAQSRFALSNAKNALLRAVEEISNFESTDIAEYREVAMEAAIGYAKQAHDCLETVKTREARNVQ